MKGVYLSIPTSNHNEKEFDVEVSFGVYLSIPTSNHNYWMAHSVRRGVFICLFLHQTTTDLANSKEQARCLSVYSYIKPQLRPLAYTFHNGVYLSIPTSNHNFAAIHHTPLIGVYLSIPTSNHNSVRSTWPETIGVYLSIPTSNHNIDIIIPYNTGSYISFFV